MISYDSPQFEEVAKNEWLVTNGLGGYASSTISGANTRRYHGLLVASLHPPTQRTVIVSRIEETITNGDGERFSISTNQYPGAVHPQGFAHISSFERTPLPVTTFQGPSFKLAKTIGMVHLSNTTVVEYHNQGKTDITLELNPFLVYRDYHSLFHQEDRFDFYTAALSEDVSVIYPFYGAPPVYIKCSGSTFHPGINWFKNLEYQKEIYRGLDAHEDACSTGRYQLHLGLGQKAHIILSMDAQIQDMQGGVLIESERKRILQLATQSTAPLSLKLSREDQQFYSDLMMSGRQFIVHRASSDGQSIIAGYHWFTDWGRDTMIAMRGLVIADGQQALAKNIIQTFLMYLKDGLIPNRFPDQGETPEYNTIDASLWMFIVLWEYHQRFNDLPFVKACLPRLQEILSAYRDGTHFRIHMTEEGLIFGGEGLSQLTWMDARVGDFVVTPRHGCPVEINVLWYNALRIYHEFQKACKIKDSGWSALAGQVKKSFRAWFLNDKGYLYDVVMPHAYVDDAFRSNQVYALSLPFELLTPEESKKLLAQITKKLWTPLGLRSLSMDHPDFVPVYGGDQWHRDGAYHQGTVWAFLMGEYMLAYLKVNAYSSAARKKVLGMMEGLKKHFYDEDCIHGISEIFDGAVPGPGRGCIHQAWSVGMLLVVFDALAEK